MPPIALQSGNAEPAVSNADKSPPGPVVPFTRASSRYIEGPFDDESQQIDGSTHVMGPFKVPSFGYLRTVRLHVTATGGAGGSAAAQADAPWSVLQSVALTDVNGNPIVGPFSGWDLYLANKWGAIGSGDPAAGPNYTAIDANGNFEFTLDVPVEFVARDALGALPNMNAAQSYRLAVTIAAKGDVYSVDPVTTLPTVRVRPEMHAWAPPSAVDAEGNIQVQEPPAVGTTHYLSKFVGSVSSGAVTMNLPRVGQMIRTLIVSKRSSGGAREDAFGETLELQFDASTMFRRSVAQVQEDMWRLFAQSPDTGVLVLSYTDDFDRAAGAELRDLYVRTTQATRLDLRATLTAAGSIEVITGDVAPAGDIFAA